MIYIIDSDSSVRRAMKRLLLASSMQVKTFASPDEFLESTFQDRDACLIVDVNGMRDRGLEVQSRLSERGAAIPIIFMTSNEAGEVRDWLKHNGAVGYFRKPIDEQALLDAIHWALSKRPADVNRPGC